MSIFRKHEVCRGLLLYKIGRYTAELWFCPSGYEIKEHSHPQEDIELMFLFGNTTFFRRQKVGMQEEPFRPLWKHVGKCSTVPAGWSHRFEVGKWPLLFINFAKWKSGVEPTSASVDFELSN